MGKKKLEFFSIDQDYPTDYKIGWIPFLNCKVDLSYKTLIPRVETEYWTEKAIGQMKKDSDKKIEVLDIFAGSGCIGLGVLTEIKNIHVDFSDFSSDSVKQIKKNLKLNKINQRRYQVFRSNVFRAIPLKKYDYILANPPYLAKTKINRIQPSVLKFEPGMSLFGGDNGLEFIETLFKQAKKYLKLQGQLWMEFDSWQKNNIEKLLKKYQYKKWEFQKDQYNRWRFVIIG